MKPKNMREDIIREVREERQNFSDRMNDQAKSVEIYDLTNRSDIIRLLSETVLIPEALEPILAKIATIGDLGTSEWYEVVYHDGNQWCCYSGSDTFKDGEKVISWKYCSDIL